MSGMLTDLGPSSSIQFRFRQWGLSPATKKPRLFLMPRLLRQLGTPEHFEQTRNLCLSHNEGADEVVG